MPSLKNDGPLIALSPTAGETKAELPSPQILPIVPAAKSSESNGHDHSATAVMGVLNGAAEQNLINSMKTVTVTSTQTPAVTPTLMTIVKHSKTPRKNGYHRTHSQYLEPNHLLHDDDEENTYENELYHDEIMLLTSTNTAGTTNGHSQTQLQQQNGSTSSPSPPLIPTPIIKPAFKNSAAAAELPGSKLAMGLPATATALTKKTAPVLVMAPTTPGTRARVPYTIDGIDASIFEPEMPRPKKIYKVVLTGGPCGGKTTGQARLCTFFENLGWKVFRVPESATVLLSGGIKFSELSEAQALRFQEDLVKTMMHIESVFFALAETVDKDVLIICDRGTMDASAFIPRERWEGILARNGWNEVDIRDTRYNHIIHMVSAANGAEPFYTIEDHATRSEGLELACKLDQKAAQAWVGHPYFDVVDNSTDFETKVCRMIQCVCQKLGIDARDRLQTNSRKVKFLVKGPLPSNDTFPPGFQDFHVVHDYLQTSVPHPKMQARLRKRGQNGYWSYTYTVRRPELQGQVIEVKTALTQRDYNNMLTQKDHNHVTIYKHRRCFLMNDQYFQLDIYDDPCHPRCKGLILLETYSTLNGTELQQRLPECLTIVKEVTGDPRYSMFNLSLKDKWENNKNFCLSLAGTDSEEDSHSAKECRLTGP